MSVEFAQNDEKEGIADDADDVEEVKMQVLNTSKSKDSLTPTDLDTNVGPIAYRMRPALADNFKAKKIKDIIQKTLTKTLQGRKYNIEEARKWTREIADTVSASVKELNMPRYKHVVQVSLGQQLGAGCRYIAKCSWDAECDSHTSDVFSNATMFCVCTVFGIYLY